VCLSCFKEEKQKYFLDNKCLLKCPYPLFPDDQLNCVGPEIDFTTEFLGASNYQAGYAPSKYTLAVLPMKRIPDGSNIYVTFPPEIGLMQGV
jgi:hypothetical protein